MNQQHSKVRITSLGDSEQALLVSARMLPRHQAQPGRQLPPVAEHSGICNGRHDRRRGNWPHALDRRDLLTAFVAGEDPLNPFFHGFNTLIERAQLFVERGKKLTAKEGQQGMLFGEQDRQLLSDLT